MVLNFLKNAFSPTPDWLAKLPKEYHYIRNQPMPRIMQEALKEYGVLEYTGAKDNPKILAWADEIGGWIGDYYGRDSIPWCGLFVGVCAKRAGYPHNQKLLSAKEWKTWGDNADKPALGDVLVFIRPNGGHVGLYVGEDAQAYHVLGGNQGNKVSITRIQKNRLKHIRRQKNWVGGKTIIVANSGKISYNEA